MLITNTPDAGVILTDEEVLERSRRDPSMFSLIVERYENALTRKAVYILKGQEDAEDAVQETFTKVYLNAGKFSAVEGATFKSWIYKILVNTCFSHYRRLKRTRELTFNVPPELMTLVSTEDPLFSEREFKDYVASIMTRVPKQVARILSLHFLEGKSHREIAESEDMTIGAVKTSVYRAKKVFRDVTTNLV